MHMDQLPGTFFGPPNLVELLEHRARRQPDNIAFTYLIDGETDQIDITYKELDRQARAIGAWLESRGLSGQRALLLYPAGLEFVAAFFGCLYAGVVAVPVYPPRRNRSMNRIQAIADDADAKVALTTDVVLNRVEPLIDETPHLKQLTWLATCHVPEGIEDEWKLPDVHGDTIAFLQYTSGSTGIPKGVMLTHANLIHNSALIAYAFEHTRSGLGVFWLPSYHDMGLIGGILQPMYMGCPNVLMSPMAFLQKPYRWLSAISRFGANTSGGPNFAYDLCVQKITPEQRETLDLSCWHLAFNGAEPVRPETLDRFAEMFEPCGFNRKAFYPCYGMAEATLIVSGGKSKHPPVIRAFESDSLVRGKAVEAEPDNEGVRSLVGCGSSLPDQKMVIANTETLMQCPEGQVGEIWVNGPSVAQGYWREPEATLATFDAHLKDTGEGPFLRTGDLGFFDEGELFVTGRVKDLIIIRGQNHYPQDIESTIQQANPRLRQDCGAVFTVETDGREQLIVVQELERRKRGNFGEVFNNIRQTVSGEHELVIDAIVLVRAGSIPKTSSGKIQRHACRSGFVDGSLSIVAQWKTGDLLEEDAKKVAKKEAAVAGVEVGSVEVAVKQATLDAVFEQVRLVAKERAVNLTADASIVETGLDSLERMEILASLEEVFGGRLPEEIFPDLETPRQVAAAIEQYIGDQPRSISKRERDVEIPLKSYRFDQFPEYVKLRQSLDMTDALGVKNPFFAVHDGILSDHTVIDGKELISFSAYNYIGMAGDPVVIQASKDAADKYGTSVSASRLVAGQKDIHIELEREISDMTRTPSALVFVSGHATNETVIGHLLGPGDLILHDGLAHNSIIQGCMLSGARRRPFPHNDWEAVDDILKKYRHDYRRVLIAIEGVYSMDGDIPDVPKFIEVKKRHKALLMIDEAHSMGAIGDHGQGVLDYFGGIDSADIDIFMGTLSKAFGSCGGYIAGCSELIDYLKYTAPGFVFSGGMSPPAAGASLAAIRLLKAEPQRAVRLHERAKLLLDRARQHGMDTGMSKDSGVVPVIIGNSMLSLQLSVAMKDRGVNVMPILHPAVEESATRLRFFVTCLHSEKQIRYTIDALAEEMEKIAPELLTESPPTAG